MFDIRAIFRNPVVPDGFYWMKVVRIETEPADYFFPKLLIHLVPLPDSRLPDGATFAAIIHPGDPSWWHYKNFFNTYMLGLEVDQLEKAIGQWGSVKVQKTEYNGTAYSSVKFTYQPLDIRLISWKIAAKEKEENQGD